MPIFQKSTRLFDPTRKSSVANGKLNDDPAAFSSTGVAKVSNGANFLAQRGIELLGSPTMYWDIATAGNATLTFAVPTAKYWKLVSAVVRVTADATAASRVVVSTSRTAAAATIEAITDGSAITANQDLIRTILYDLAINTRGNAKVASAATLTIAEPVTSGDTFSIGGPETAGVPTKPETESALTKFAVVTAFTGSNENEILIGANEAATKANIDLALGASRAAPSATTHSVSNDTFTKLNVTAADFSGDVMVFTAGVKGGVGDLITCVETFTHASNIFDAATFGTTTAGVDAVTNHSAATWPAAGTYLTPAQDVVFSVTAGVAGDNFEVFLTVIEYDSDPTAVGAL